MAILSNPYDKNIVLLDDEEAVVFKWKRNDTGWWYEYPDGSYPKKREKIDGTWYTNERGYSSASRLKDDGKWYH